MTQRGDAGGLSLPRPKGALLVILVIIGIIWVTFGLLINWVGVGDDLFRLLIVDRDRVLRGELWRLFSAPFFHVVSGKMGVSHVVSNALMLYFFGASLQTSWGSKRLVIFLFAAALTGEVLQIGLDKLIPALIAPGVHQSELLGAEAMAIGATLAWGLGNKGQRVALMMVLPISAMTLVWFTLGMYLLSLIATGAPPEGMFAPLGGLLVGWLGSGTPPLWRRSYLRWKLRGIEGKQAARRRDGPKLRVIRGERDDDDPPPPRGSDKRWLN